MSNELRAGSNAFARLVYRFVRQRDAMTTVEFAILLAPFVAGQTLETAAAASARLIQTGQAQTSGWSAAQFKAQVCNQIHGIFSCNSGVYVDVETYPSFSSISLGLPVTNGAFDPSAINYNPGGPGDIVMLRLYYQYPVFV